jgi:dipeptidyl aminopeptidase/acylaminoacyl peptidase
MMITGILALFALAQAVEVTWVGGGHGSNPQWSTDGNWLAFEVNNNSDKVDLYVVKMTTGAPGAPTKIVIPGSSSSFSGGGGFAAAPVWHPKQSILLFSGANAGGTMRLYFLSASNPAPAEYVNGSQAPGSLAWPAISPDGSTVAFTTSASGAGDVMLFSQQTNKVTAAFPSTKESENAPSFGPDSKQIVFSRKNYGSEDVFTVAGGSGAAAVPVKGATGNGDQTRPRVVASDTVYFSSERGVGHWDIGVVPTSGGDRRILAKDVRLPIRTTPAMTPDGSAVLYGSSEPSKDGSVFITRLDGSSTSEIKTGLAAVGEPALTTVGGKSYLSFTALPSSGSDWRQLHVVDVTGKF